MRVETEVLQKLVAKVVKGAGNNKMLPVTSLLIIEVKDSQLMLSTTDGNNIFKAKTVIDASKIDTDNFYTIVNAELFAKLVGKTTKEYIELNNKANYLEVTGNGTYKLEIAVNEEGQLVTFDTMPEYEESIEINLKDLQNAIMFAKATVAKTLNIPMLTGYYLADDVITTDQQMACRLDAKLVDRPLLLSSETAELLLLVEGQPTIKLARKDNKFCFSTDAFIIYGSELDGKDIYPVKPIENLLTTQYESMIRVEKQVLINALDRLNLFVADYDKGGVFLDFSDAVLSVRSQKSNACEPVNVISSENAVDGQYLVNINMLKALLQVLVTDTVEMHYGTAKSIKLLEGNASLVIALQNE